MSITLQIIYSEFHEKVGPMAVGFYPKDVLKYTKSVVSGMTIDLLGYKKEDSSRLALNPLSQLVIMTFPQLNRKGLVKYLEWEDITRRGGTRIITLTILFEEKDDPILYKYKADIEEAINKFLLDFIPFVKKEDYKDNLEEKLKKVHNELQDLLQKLSLQEINIKEDSKAFPQTQDQARKADFGIKTIIVGDPGVGKTSTVLQFTEKAFRRSYIPTIGVNITETTIDHNQGEFHLLLWDLAGQSKFHGIRSLYYAAAQFVVIIFDLTKPESYENVKKWYSDVKSALSNFEDLEVVMCGNKSDLKGDILISEEMAIQLASELNIAYLETSALNGKNIHETFVKMIESMLAKKNIKI